MPELILPGITDRVAVVGATGTGKTHFATWLLSQARFDEQPFIIVNYKQDELLNSIPRVREIGYGELPQHPGLYMISPHPKDDDYMEDWLHRVWARENTGLFFDEAYMVPDSRRGAFSAILTQGRSKHIPAIVASQRPVWLNKFVYSEAQYYAVFRLQHRKDYAKVAEYMPGGLEISALPEHYSRWYDVRRNVSLILKPVPEADTLLEIFDSRLKPKHKVF